MRVECDLTTEEVTKLEKLAKSNGRSRKKEMQFIAREAVKNVKL